MEKVGEKWTIFAMIRVEMHFQGVHTLERCYPIRILMGELNIHAFLLLHLMATMSFPSRVHRMHACIRYMTCIYLVWMQE